MPAAVYRGKGDLVVEHRPVPRPGAGEVLVEVSHCGVCGSDLHMVLDGWGRPGTVGGHEWSGRVAAVGPETDGWLVGTRVVGGDLVPCGRCPFCATGRPSLCQHRGPVTGGDLDGAFATFVVTAASGLVAVEDGMPLRTAALTEPLAVALHAITGAAPGPGRGCSSPAPDPSACPPAPPLRP